VHREFEAGDFVIGLDGANAVEAGVDQVAVGANGL